MINHDFGKLILRVCVGGLMLFHGIFKLQYGIDGVTGLLESRGLPTFMAYGVYVGEILASHRVSSAFSSTCGDFHNAYSYL